MTIGADWQLKRILTGYFVPLGREQDRQDKSAKAYCHAVPPMRDSSKTCPAPAG